MKPAPLPEAVPLQIGTPKKPRARGAFRPSAEALSDANAKYAAAEAAVRVAIVGPELDKHEVGVKNWVDTIDNLTRALAFYVAHVQLGVGKKLLAAARGVDPATVRRNCRFVEAWRAAPLPAACLAQVEAALPRSL